MLIGSFVLFFLWKWKRRFSLLNITRSDRVTDCFHIPQQWSLLLLAVVCFTCSSSFSLFLIRCLCSATRDQTGTAPVHPVPDVIKDNFGPENRWTLARGEPTCLEPGVSSGQASHKSKRHVHSGLERSGHARSRPRAHWATDCGDILMHGSGAHLEWVSWLGSRTRLESAVWFHEARCQRFRGIGRYEESCWGGEQCPMACTDMHSHIYCSE